MPTSELSARGSWRAKARKGEPAPLAAPPTRPEWVGDTRDPLYGVLIETWDQLADHLTGRKVLGPGDVIALGLLCEALRDYVNAKRMLLEEGETVPGAKDGTVVVNPLSRVRDKAFSRVVVLLREFGLTPSARAAAAIVEGMEAQAEGKGKLRFFAPPA